MNRSTKAILIIVYLAILFGGITFILSSTPAGPWEGMYQSFWTTWIAIFIAAISLIIASQKRSIDVSRNTIVGAVLLVVALIAAQTLKWGVPYGIRDPWTHLYYSKSTIFFGDNPYPILHSLANVVNNIIGVDPVWLIARTQVLAPMLGILWLAAYLRRDVDNKNWLLVLLGFFPVVFAMISPISRPYTLAPLYVILFWLIITATEIETRKRELLAMVLVFISWWHPVASGSAAFIFVLLMCGNYISRTELVSIIPSPPSRSVNGLLICLSLVFFTAFHLLVLTDVGTRILTRVLSSGTVEQGVDTAGASLEPTGQSVSSSPVLFQIISNFSEFIRRTVFVSSLGILSLVALIDGWKEKNIDRLVIASLGAFGVNLCIFIMIDVIGGTGFGPRRGVLLSALFLLPAAARGFQRIPGSVPRVLVAVLVMTSGMLVVYDSPFNGGTEFSNTKSDPAAITWQNTYRTDGPVVGSESTYHIVAGIYGRDKQNEWANGSRFYYQDIRNRYYASWTVPPRTSGTYYAVDAVARLKTEKSATELDDKQLSDFTYVNNEIYNNGGSQWFFYISQ